VKNKKKEVFLYPGEKEGTIVGDSTAVRSEKLEPLLRKASRDCQQEIRCRCFAGHTIISTSGDPDKVRNSLRKFKPEYDRLWMNQMVKSLGKENAETFEPPGLII